MNLPLYTYMLGIILLQPVNQAWGMSTVHARRIRGSEKLKGERQRALDGMFKGYDPKIPPNYEEGSERWTECLKVTTLRYRQTTKKVILHAIKGPIHKAPKIPPNYEEDFPVEVFVQLHIMNIDSISESNMDYTIGMFLRQTWNDSRLCYTALPRLRSLELDSRVMDNIWVPDLFIANEKEAHFHLVTVPNKLMHIYPEGRVQYSIRISATLKCNMDLRKYPLDKQHCSVILESYGYSTENVVFSWNEEPVLQGRLILPQFQLGPMETLRCDKQYVGGAPRQADIAAVSTGPMQTLRCDKQYVGVNYTCIMLEFEITRSFGFYITQVYIPSILIVILSWVSFWLDIDAVPARISLGLLTVLTMTTQSSGARASLPKVSYIKGIDVWMAACLIFVFAALIEFAWVNVLSRVEKRRKSTTVNYGNQPGHSSTKAAEANGSREGVELGRSRFLSIMPSSREKARTVDRLARLLFPSVFIAFNLIYWSVYLFWEPNRTDVA